jgi:hypothetical protein
LFTISIGIFYKNLNLKATADYCTFAGTLSTIMLGMSAINASYLETHPLLATISAGIFALGGGTMFIDMITATARKAHLEHKLEEIYEIMGPEFKHEVMQEKQNRKK